MQLRFKLLLVPILYFFIRGNSQNGTNTYTLQQCVEVAINNNADVNNAQFQQQVADVGLQQAKANKLPSISANIGHNLYNGRSINIFTNSYTNQQYLSASYSLGGSVTLWNGSSIQNYLRQTALATKASEMDVQQAKDKLVLNVVLFYLSVLGDKEQLDIAQQQLAATAKKVSLLETKNREGAIPPSDLYDMQGQLATDKLNVTTTKNALATAKLTLAQAMNIPYSADMDFAEVNDGAIPSPYNATIDEIYEHASQNLAMVKAGELRKESTVKAIDAAKGKLLPTLSLSGGLYTNFSSTATTLQLQNTTDLPTSEYILVNNTKSYVYSQQSSYTSQNIGYGSQWKNNFSSAIGLNLSIPILNGLQARNNIALAKINERQADFQVKTIKIQLRQAIEQDFVNMSTAYETYKTLQEQLGAYTKSFQATELKYGAGAISTTDYLIVKNNLDKANLNLNAARFDYIFKTKILDFYLGRRLW